MKLMKPDSMHSKPLSQSGANESQLNTAAIPKKNNHLLNKIEIAHSNPTDARKEINVSDAQTGSKKIDSSNLHNRAVTKGVPDDLGSNENIKVNKLSASFTVHSASLMEQKFESKTLKGLNSRLQVSSIPAILNSKSISVEGNKLSPLEAGKRPLMLLAQNCQAPKTLLQSNLQTEKKSLKHLHGNAVMHISLASKIDNCGILSMKRKISEVRNNENLLGSHHFSPTSAIHRDAYMKEFEMPLLMEDDGIVEKAEACAKELDSASKICNMKKPRKHLKLFSFHDKHIRMVHRIAARLSRELQI